MKPYAYLIIILLACGACGKTLRKTPNGFDITVLREGTGEYAVPGQFLVMNMTYKDEKDSAWFDTQKLERPGVVMVPDTAVIKNEKGMESIFRVLKKGDSVTFKVVAKSLFEDTWRTQVPPNVKPESHMIFHIGVKDILDREGINKLQQELEAKQYEKSKEASKEQLAKDIAAIDEYLKANKIAATTTTEGVRYVITKPGSGPSPAVSSTIKVNYKGTLLADGTEFDASQSPMEWPLANLIQGWQIGFQKLQRGSKATLYIPSSLGYGEMGSPPQIPANANLVFEVELIDFK